MRGIVDYSRSHIRRYERPGPGNGVPGQLLEVTVAETGEDQEPTGQVVVSVEVLEQLLSDAGWERAS